MRRLLVLAVILAATGVAGCGAQETAATPRPSVSYDITVIGHPAGSRDPEANIPNPGTGSGDPRLVAALLPHQVADRFDLPAAVIAMPDRNRGSLFIGLRLAGSPVVGPPECDGWTSGLWNVLLSRYNVACMQLALTKLVAPTPSGPVQVSEEIITGPGIGELASPVLPATCRTIAGLTRYKGGVKMLSVPRLGQLTWAYEVTGTGEFPVWTWAEVVRGPDFVMELRIPNQAPAPTAPMASLLPGIAATAYHRALTAIPLRRAHCPAALSADRVARFAINARLRRFRHSVTIRLRGLVW